MNRNIIWEKDVAHARAKAAAGSRASGAPPPPDPDSRSERLLKFIPGEAIGLYLFLESAIKAAATPPESSGSGIISANEKQILLWISLGVALVFNWLYLLRVWKVQRSSQRLISCVALVVYVFAGGGAFATYAWYKPLYGTLALAIAGAFLIFAPEPPGKPINV